MGFIALRAHLIFQFSEHVLFVYIDVKQNKTKIPDFIKNLMKVKFCWRQIWANLIIHKPSLRSRKVPQKLGPDRCSHFDAYWIQTGRKIDRQTDKQSLYIDVG